MVSRTIARRAARLAIGATLLLSGFAAAQTTLLNEVHTIATPDTAVPVEHTFTIANAGTYKVTLTDLGASLTPPAPLTSAKLAITQGNSIVGTPAVLTTGSATASLTFTATANTAYTLHVVGAPATGTNSGLIGENVTAADGSSVQGYVDSLALSVPAVANGESIVNDTFSVATQATYTISLTDLKLPKALKGLILAVVPTGSGAPVATLPVPVTNAMQTSVSLATGTYQLVAIGKTDPTDAAALGGLFSVNVVGPSGPLPHYPKIVPVGAVTQVQSAQFAAMPAGSYSFQLADLNYPNPLATLAAALIRDDGVAVAGPVSGSGNQSFTVSSGSTNSYLAFAVAAPQTTSPALGSYSLQVQSTPAAATPPISVARIVGTTSASTGTTSPAPFSFDIPTVGGGSYTITATDFSFPGPLTTINMAAVQNGKVLATLNTAGNFTATAAPGPMTLLVYSQAPSGGSVFGIDVSPGSGASVFSVTQSVGTAFVARPVTITSNGNYQANAADLGFPANFASFYVLVTHGPQVAGKIIASGGAGKFSFDATVGTYLVNFIAIPSSTDKAGTYSLAVAPTPPAPTVTLSANVTHVASGGTVTLTWSSQNATSCSASGGWTGTQATSGTATSAALTAATNFTLTCTGSGGTGSQSVSVTIDSSSSGGGGGGGGAFGLVTLLGLAGGLLAQQARTLKRPASSR